MDKYLFDKDIGFPLSTGECGDSDDLYLNFTTFENLRLEPREDNSQRMVI
jgi:hypothetical protein